MKSIVSRPFDDSATCFHGSGIYEDCNSRLWARNLMIRYAYILKNGTTYICLEILDNFVKMIH